MKNRVNRVKRDYFAPLGVRIAGGALVSWNLVVRYSTHGDCKKLQVLQNEFQVSAGSNRHTFMIIFIHSSCERNTDWYPFLFDYHNTFFLVRYCT